MSEGSIFLWLGIVLLFILLNGFFVAAEFAVVKLRKSRVEEMVKGGVLGAGLLRRSRKTSTIASLARSSV